MRSWIPYVIVRAGISLEKAAALTGYVPSSIRQYADGYRPCSEIMRKRFTEALGLDPRWVFAAQAEEDAAVCEWRAVNHGKDFKTAWVPLRVTEYAALGNPFLAGEAKFCQQPPLPESISRRGPRKLLNQTVHPKQEGVMSMNGLDLASYWQMEMEKAEAARKFAASMHAIVIEAMDRAKKCKSTMKRAS